MDLKKHHISGLKSALEYAEAGLDDGEATIEGMAYYACMSPYHFDRMFKMATNIPPAEYLRLRRLSEAGIQLYRTKEQITQVALKFGYTSPDSFGKAFKKHFCATPVEIRKLGVLPYIILPRMTLPEIPAEAESIQRSGIIELEDKIYAGLYQNGDNQHSFNMQVDYNLFKNETARSHADKFIYLDRTNKNTGIHEMFLGFEIKHESELQKGLQILRVEQHKSICVTYCGHADTEAEAQYRGRILRKVISDAQITINESIWKTTRSIPDPEHPGWRNWTIEIPVI